MRLKTFFLLLLLIICCVFLVVNWTAILTEVPVNFLVDTVDAPIALIVLLGLGVLVIICLLYALWLQASLALEMRKSHRETEAARALAENAEKSRFSELKSEMQKAFAELQTDADLRKNSVIDRVDALEKRFDEGFVQTINSLSSSVGEVEDSVHKIAKDVKKLQTEDSPEAVPEQESSK